MKNKEKRNKDSKLVFEPGVWSNRLKKSPILKDKYCRQCGKPLDDNCGCPQPVAEIIDCKPYRDENGISSRDRSVMVFKNTPAFQKALSEIMNDIKSKKEPEYEQITFDEVM